jgi:glycosyltransferase involved in cell wall biosynthesis
MRRVSTKVQIQVHADICDYEWIKLSWKNRFKSAIAIRILAYTDSIRFVSTSQKRLVHEKQNRKPREEIVIPVFLNLGSRDVEQSWERPRVIGFVGRMEKERGTRSLIQLVEKLSTDSRQNFQVTLIGSGREEISTRDRLEQLLGPDNVRALGQISAEQLIHEWENIGVLVNLAPSESYGRSMREAAASGVPVWSVPSNGFMEFKYKFNQRWIRELKLNDSAEILQKTFDMLLSSKTTGEIREALLSEQEYFLDELVKSWVCNDSE